MYKYNSKKVWSFLKNEVKLDLDNINLTSKELFEKFIENNPKILSKYIDYECSYCDNEISPMDLIIEEKRKTISRINNNLNETVEVPTFYEMKYYNSSKIFEAEEIKNSKATPEELQQAEEFYNKIIESVKDGKDLDEGLLTGLIGGATGALIGPAIGKAICKVLGIDINGHLGKLLTSRLVTTAMGYELGK